MDIEKLIEQLNGYFDGKTLTRGAALDAATALSTLQAESEKLRAELEQVKAERDAAVSDLERIKSCKVCKYCDSLKTMIPIVCQKCHHGDNWEWRSIKED